MGLVGCGGFLLLGVLGGFLDECWGVVVIDVIVGLRSWCYALLDVIT